MKKLPKLSMACSLLCAAGSLWCAVADLFDVEVSVPRRAWRVSLWLTSCAVWTSNLVLELAQNAGEDEAAPVYVELIEEEHCDE